MQACAYSHTLAHNNRPEPMYQKYGIHKIPTGPHGPTLNWSKTFLIKQQCCENCWFHQPFVLLSKVLSFFMFRLVQLDHFEFILCQRCVVVVKNLWHHYHMPIARVLQLHVLQLLQNNESHTCSSGPHILHGLHSVQLLLALMKFIPGVQKVQL